MIFDINNLPRRDKVRDIIYTDRAGNTLVEDEDYRLRVLNAQRRTIKKSDAFHFLKRKNVRLAVRDFYGYPTPMFIPHESRNK